MFKLQLSNLFWYFAIYGLLSLFCLKGREKEKQKKVLAYTDTPSNIQKYAAITAKIVRFASMILSIFIPIYFSQPTLIIGNIIYFLGAICSTIALYQYLNADLNKPIITGIYRYSRHPMQVFYVVMLIGMTIISLNPIFAVLTALYAVSFYPSLEGQEAFCTAKYGEEYTNYMNTTKRILQFKNNKSNYN